MKVRTRLLLLAGVVAGIGALGGWLNTDEAQPDTALAEHTYPPIASEVNSVIASALSPRLTLSELQSTSRHDVDVPHSINVDTNGNLVADEDLRTLMDFFLALDGEKDLAQIRALFLAAAAAQCDPACVDAVAAIFDQYQAYLAAMESQQPELSGTDDLQARLQAVSSLRQQLLGQELASGLFAYEEAYDTYRINQWAIRNDANLSAGEQQQQLDILRASAPPGLQEREQQNRRLHQARQLRQKMGSNTAELYAARIDLLGQDAADRLQQLDQQRAQWDQRYQQYRQELTALQTSNISEQDQAQQVTALRQRHFSGSESTRVEALDRINGSVP